MKINGNTTAYLQKLSVSVNEIGEPVEAWATIETLENGYLDYTGQMTSRDKYNTKKEDSTHIFICDYVAIDKKVENKRMLVDNDIYDVLEIDDPMGLHRHLEIYLKYVGGQ